jgi:hypothetical protein
LENDVAPDGARQCRYFVDRFVMGMFWFFAILITINYDLVYAVIAHW